MRRNEHGEYCENVPPSLTASEPKAASKSATSSVRGDTIKRVTMVNYDNKDGFSWKIHK